jgi:two-component sensor histidine kinase
MTTPAFTVTAPLSTRLLRRIVLLSLALILLLAGLRAWWEYRQVLTEAENVIDSVMAAEAKPLANSLWEMNRDQLRLHLEGVVGNRAVSYAAVTEQGETVAAVGVRKGRNALERSVPLLHGHEGRDVELGRLIVQADLDLAEGQALRAAAVSLSFSTILGGVLCLGMFLLIRSMVSRHLTTAAEHFQSLRLNQAGLALSELRLHKKWAGDELDILCLAVNHMQENLARTYIQARLADSEARSQARFPEENPNPVLRVGGQGQLMFANQPSQGFLAAIGAVAGQPVPEPYRSMVQEALASGSMQEFEIEFDGRTFFFKVRPILPEGYVNLYGLDITLRKKALEDVQRSLEEKEILLKEIHHRVKNNLQIISSLLFLQMEYVRQPEDRELFTESQRRIQAMALVHEELYGAKDFASVNMREYVPRLVERVLGGAQMPVQMEFAVDEICLPVTRSIPCGLILNELAMNAVKHAFRSDRGRQAGAERTRGHLWVSLRRAEGKLVLEVEDDGPGLPPGFDIAAAPSLGMTLISSLSSQLGGEMAAMNSAAGALFRLVFPEDADA